MGNQGLIRALHRIALTSEPGGEPLFENVILAAPDFDAQVFTEQIAPQIVGLARRWTLYASANDQALRASSILSVPRLGMPLALTPGVDTVDASGIDVTPWSVPEFHSYYASKQRVILDLVGVLEGLGPAERHLLINDDGPVPYWVVDGGSQETKP
jgi:esterase/lipase superfamily enzyme